MLRVLREARALLIGFGALFLAAVLFTHVGSDAGFSTTGVGGAYRNVGGRFGAWLADLMLMLFGLSAWWWVLLSLYYVVYTFNHLDETPIAGSQQRWFRLAGFALLLLGSCGMEWLRLWHWKIVLPDEHGGVLGIAMGGAANGLLGFTGGTLFLLLAMGVGFSLFTGVSWLNIPHWAGQGRVDVRIFTRRFMRLAALVLIPAVLAGCGVNSIPTKQERAKASWADVQSQYQRRADLVPNLVATVQGYANQEKTVLVAVTEARASATQVKVDASTVTDPAAFQRYQAAQNQLSGVLGRLLAISENYPDLKSNQNFLALQSQLEGTENRISVARRDYNESVRDYDTTLRTLPGSLWAGSFYRSAKPMQLFEATATSQSAPKVSFTPPAAPPAATPAAPK